MDELDKALEQLEHFKDLERNWDSYGGAPIDKKAIATMRVIVTALRGIFVAPMSDGGVDLDCEAEGCIFNLSIGADGEIELYIRGGELEREWSGCAERQKEGTPEATAEEEGHTEPQA